MALVHCRGCGQQIHESAPACPHCGAPQGAPGSGPSAPIPEGVKGWSWGAFFLNWIWGPFNGTWIALLALIPFVGFVMAIVLGLKGREWAWKNKKWDSLEHFNRVQRAWSVGGVVMLIVPVIGVLASIALPAYQDYVNRAKVAVETARIEGEQVAAVPVPQLEPQQYATSQVIPAQPAETVVASTNPVLAAEPEGVAYPDLISKATVCSEGHECVHAMLDAASPRRPEVIQAAASRLVGLETAAAGDKKLSRDLNTLALAKYSANDFGGAIDLFIQAAQVNPRDAEVQSNLGLAYVRAGKPNEAVNTLISALKLDPRRSSAWAPLAEAYDQTQMPDAAYAALLLAYEFSGNKQKTMDFFRARSSAAGVGESLRIAYSHALKTAESGY